jgi:hypothetical protein
MGWGARSRSAPQLFDIAGDLIPLTSQPLVVALLPFDFGDKVVTSISAPARVHVLAMPSFDREYKRKSTALGLLKLLDRKSRPR